MNIVEIESGLELNLAVLKALGAVWRDEWKDATGWKMAAWYYEDGSVACREQIPQFSTDLNAAFAAAEKVNLFEPKKFGAIISRVEVGWVVHWRGPGEATVFGDTPALAICAAIRKVRSQ